jgi:hypothetical protein
MPLTIGQVFDLPAREAITAGGFVVKLADDGSSKLVSDYVGQDVIGLPTELPRVPAGKGLRPDDFSPLVFLRWCLHRSRG